MSSIRNDNAYSFVTGDIIHDRMNGFPYNRLSRKEEINFIKKSKLSYYNELDDEKKAEYLKYYMEMFPRFKKKYEEANEEKKKVLLKSAVENSKRYRDAFLGNNYRLVCDIVKIYMFFDEFENLFQEGVIGMMKALKKFDFSKNTRFSTYATIWIRQAITRYIQDKSSAIHIPVSKRDQIVKLEKLQNLFQIGSEVKLSNDDLAEKMGISLEELEDLLVAQQRLHLKSLNDPVLTDDDASELADFIASDEADFTEIVDSDIMRESLRNLIETMNFSDREKLVLNMRYGFYDGKKYTLSEIGDVFEVTRERIRQIELAILKKLRFNVKLRNYYDNISEGSFMNLDDDTNYQFRKK